MSAPKFFIVSVLMRTDTQLGASSFALTTSYRVVPTEAEALGAAIQFAMESNPGALVAGKIITEVPADDIAMAHTQISDVSSRAQRTPSDNENCRATPVPDTGIPKDHEIREAVNTLRDIAVQFHATQQLRERIAYFIVPLLRRAAAPVSSTPTSGAVEKACQMGEHACNNAAQCWEPCGQLGKSAEHAAPSHPPEAKAGEDA